MFYVFKNLTLLALLVLGGVKWLNLNLSYEIS